MELEFVAEITHTDVYSAGDKEYDVAVPGGGLTTKVFIPMGRLRVRASNGDFSVSWGEDVTLNRETGAFDGLLPYHIGQKVTVSVAAQGEG